MWYEAGIQIIHQINFTNFHSIWASDIYSFNKLEAWWWMREYLKQGKLQLENRPKFLRSVFFFIWLIYIIQVHWRNIASQMLKCNLQNVITIWATPPLEPSLILIISAVFFLPKKNQCIRCWSIKMSIHLPFKSLPNRWS